VLVAPLTVFGHWNRHRDRDTVWVANRDSGTVTVFTTDGEIVGDRMVVPGAHDIVVSPRAGKAFVSDDASRVYVFSTTTHEPVVTIQFGLATRPHHMSLSHDGKTVYVGLFASNRVASIDVRTHEVREFPSSLTAGVTAHAPEPSPNDRFIYVPHEGQNLVTKMSARRENVRAEAVVGDVPNSSPSEVLSTRDGKILYVSMRVENLVRTIDLDTFQATSVKIPVGPQPESLILTPGERTLIVSLRGKPARLAFVDTDTNQLEQTLDIGEADTNGNLAVASPDGDFVYATVDAAAGGTGTVAKVDVRKRKVVKTFVYPETGRTHGIAYLDGRGRHH
jgi:DNA-binding beta-propeller fold protein YncE